MKAGSYIITFSEKDIALVEKAKEILSRYNTTFTYLKYINGLAFSILEEPRFNHLDLFEALAKLPYSKVEQQQIYRAIKDSDKQHPRETSQKDSLEDKLS